ncbi:rhamnogalacturonan lyase [Ereboglobus luteus]
MRMKRFHPISLRLLALFVVLGAGVATAAPSQMEALDRGVVAVRATKSSAFVSWRLLGTEASDMAFDIYRTTDGGAPVKLNTAPLAKATHFTDKSADFSKTNTYSVRAITGEQSLPAAKTTSLNTLRPNAPVRQYISIPLRIPEGGVTPAGESYTYNANDCSVGDLDGDGEYEIILKWDPTNAHDNAHDGYTGNVYIDAYKLDGTFLWRIDLGKNIRAGAHYTQFQVYDFDGDGFAEVACKTADGTIDGVGKVIGDANADHRGTEGRHTGRILSGPEYLTIFNGRTGAAMSTVQYLPQRDPENRDDNPDGARQKKIWGDAHGNRIDRFLAATAYLDGSRPSLVMCRGYYTRAVLVAWDWRGGKLAQRWIFDSEDGTPGNKKYNGQGAHSVTVGDVDGDGCDEIIYGAAAINNDGTGLYSTGLGHGDALHMSVMDPDRGGQQVFMVHESRSSYGDAGIEYRDARTGMLLFGVGPKGDEWGKKADIGRGVAADIDPRTKGYEMWASYGALYDNKGNVISKTPPREKNFLIWWDGDLLREFLDGDSRRERAWISKWNWKTQTSDMLFSDPECVTNNGTKATPCLSGDIFGDWREEVIWRTKDNRELRIYTTTIPTEHRLHTLMHDRQYRLAIAWQNTTYNQPPHPGFYLGEGMKPPAKPDIVTAVRSEK